MHVSQKFERLRDAHRRPDGSRWSGQQLDEATGGVVTRSCKGRIQSPGREKMVAIAKAMGFPPEAWFGEYPVDATPVASGEGPGIAGRVERLFETIRHPKTGEPFTNAQVARMSAGDLTEGDVEGIRTVRLAYPNSPCTS